MIFLSGPASNPISLAFNSGLTGELEKAGFAVFLPQRDSINPKKPPYSEMTRQERSQVIFEKFCDLIFACDVFLFIIDRRVPEEGQIFNLGMAYAHRLATGCNRLIIGFQTDGSLFLGAKLHPTLNISLDQIVGNRKELIEVLVNHKNGMPNRL